MDGGTAVVVVMVTGLGDLLKVCDGGGGTDAP